MLSHSNFYSFSFLLFVLFLYKASSEFNLNHLHTPQFQTRNFETTIEGKSLDSSLVFLNLNVVNEEECMHKCLVYKDCFSYNLGPKQSELMICELCNKVRFGGEARLVNKTGYKHRSTVSSCSNKTCTGQNVICIPNLQTTTNYQCLLLYVDVEVKGYGMEDPPGPINNTFMDSYFKINGKKYPLSSTVNSSLDVRQLFVTGKLTSSIANEVQEACQALMVDKSACKNFVQHLEFLTFKVDRGHTFRVITCNGDSVTVGPNNTLDTYGDTAAGSKMASFVSSIPAKSIVLVVVADTANYYSNANALISLGATSPATFGFREAWAFIGFKGETKPWIVDKKTARYRGPASVTARIPYTDLV